VIWIFRNKSRDKDENVLKANQQKMGRELVTDSIWYDVKIEAN